VVGIGVVESKTQFRWSQTVVYRLQNSEQRISYYRWPLRELCWSDGVYETMHDTTGGGGRTRVIDEERGGGRNRSRGANVRPRRPWNSRRPRPMRERRLFFESWCSSPCFVAELLPFSLPRPRDYIYPKRMFFLPLHVHAIRPSTFYAKTPIDQRNWSRKICPWLRLAKLIPAIRALRAFVMLLIFYVNRCHIVNFEPRSLRLFSTNTGLPHIRKISGKLKTVREIREKWENFAKLSGK